MELGLDLKLRSWSWNWSWNLRSCNWSWSWNLQSWSWYSGDLPELELELKLPELELELIYWRLAGVGVGVETSGVGVELILWSWPQPWALNDLIRVFLLQSFSSIIGPNGSGKSNVIDSMLFVFGYRANKIRSKKISVLLHNSEQHKNITSCTVAVHFQKIIDTGVSSRSKDLKKNAWSVMKM